MIVFDLIDIFIRLSSTNPRYYKKILLLVRRYIPARDFESAVYYKLLCQFSPKIVQKLLTLERTFFELQFSSFRGYQNLDI